jgi:hypothetical protein
MLDSFTLELINQSTPPSTISQEQASVLLGRAYVEYIIVDKEI